MKFNFRKIASAIASTAMLGSTVALAAAANFPAPFVQNGAADVAIVYGNSLDLVAVTDISTSLSSALAGAGGSAGALTNDAYALFTSSTPLELNKSLNSVRTSVTKSNLPSALGDTDFSGNVDAEAQFKINLGSNPRAIFAKEPTTSVDPDAGLFFGTSAANYLYNATITFDEAINFTHADSQGEEIILFGEKFTVASATTNSKIVLLKSAETLYLTVGSANANPSQTIVVDDKTYTVELTAATDTSATVKVTDSSGKSDQKEINEAASKKILGVEVAVNNADESTATNTLSAEVVVGANRLTLQDGNEVKVGTDETAIEGTSVDMDSPAYMGNVSWITVQIFAPDGSSDFFKSGDEFVDPVFGGFRLVFDGLSVELDDTENREDITIKPSGTDMASITFTSWQGETLTNFEWLNNRTSGPIGVFLGDSNDWRLVVREQGIVNESGYAVLGNEDDGVLIKLTSISNASTLTDKDKITVKDMTTGESVSADSTSEGTGTIDIGGVSYTFNYWDNKAGDNSEHVRFNSPDSSAGELVLYPTIETSKGANLAFYEPLNITLDDIDGVGTDATGFTFPDGDGFTDIAMSKNDTSPALWFITFGSTQSSLNTSSAGASVSGAVGQLTYNITSTGTANNTETYLVEPSGGNILRPSIVLFEEKDESSVYNVVIVESSGGGVSDAGVSISDVSFTWNGDADMKNTAYGAGGYEKESQDKFYVKMDQWGLLSTMDQTDSDQYNVVLSYPNQQVTAKIYVDAVGSGSGSKTLGDVKVMDDELASSGMSGKNLVVVGGSCVNTAASTLLSNAGCGASWTVATGAGSGEWIIQSFANPWASSKVATLVAGWEQGDTANAATYLRTQNPKTDVGHKLKGTTSTTATVVTA